MENFCKKPCKHCPFRNDVKPFLTAERGEELAYLTQNKYNIFPCHKTTKYNEYSENMEIVQKTKMCAGFLTMQMIENGDKFIPEGFEPSFELVYESILDMIDAYENQ